MENKLLEKTKHIRLIETKYGHYKIQQLDLICFSPCGYREMWIDRTERIENYDQAVLEYDFIKNNGIPEFFGEEAYHTPARLVMFKDEIKLK